MKRAIAVIVFWGAYQAGAMAQSCYDSMIMDPVPFLGNGQEIITLLDGTKWKDLDFQYLYLYEYYPSVTICPGTGKMYLGPYTFNVAPLSTGTLTPVCTLSANPVSIAAGGISTLTASCSPIATSYVWTGGTCAGTSGASCTVTPSASTTYTVAGINSAGSGAAARATVTVTPSSTSTPVCTLTAIPTSIAAAGTSILTASCSPAATSYVWSANTGFSSTVTSGTVSPTVTTTYTVAGVNSVGTSAAASATVTVTPTSTPAQGALENPIAGSTESGIGVISGWHCTASRITAEIDGVNLGKAGSGTNRPDTASVCGHAETGYSLLINYSALAPGSHTIRVYADGTLSETRQFNSIQSGGAEFATGLSKAVAVSDFPSSGKTATLQWSEAKQSFVITQVEQTGPAVDLSSLNGSDPVVANPHTVSGSGCAALGIRTGTYTVYWSASAATSGSQLTFNLWASGSYYTYTLNYQSGDSSTGFNFSGTFRETVSGMSGTASVLSLKNSLTFAPQSNYSGFLIVLCY